MIKLSRHPKKWSLISRKNTTRHRRHRTSDGLIESARDLNVDSSKSPSTNANNEDDVASKNETAATKDNAETTNDATKNWKAAAKDNAETENDGSSEEKSEEEEHKATKKPSSTESAAGSEVGTKRKGEHTDSSDVPNKKKPKKVPQADHVAMWYAAHCKKEDLKKDKEAQKKFDV